MVSDDNETEQQRQYELDEAPLRRAIAVCWSRYEPRFDLHTVGARALTIGRSAGADVVVADKAVSGKHVTIAHDGAAWQLSDLGSTNGTFVDGQRVHGTLRTRDARTLRVGETVLTLFPDAARFDHGLPTFENGYLVGPQMRVVFNVATAAGRRGHSLFIIGETGAGKERVAAVFHQASTRTRVALTTINCARLSRELAESELFGAMRGAYSGAIETRDGYFAEAHGGVLFLDEVADLELAVQAKILRAVELGEFQRLGSTSVRKVDVLVCAATHPRVRTMVADGRFRDDLFARLAQRVVEVPPLRERYEETALLVAWALGTAPTAKFSAAAIDECLRAHWPTNVRGFRGIIGTAVDLAEAAKRSVVEPKEVLKAIQAASTAPIAPPQPVAESKRPSKAPRSLAQELDAHRREVVTETYRRLGSVTKAAKALGIARNTMYEALRKYGVTIRAESDDED